MYIIIFDPDALKKNAQVGLSGLDFTCSAYCGSSLILLRSRGLKKEIGEVLKA